MVGTTWMGQLARTQTLDEAPASIDQSQFFKGVADTVKVDGKTYGVPWYVASSSTLQPLPHSPPKRRVHFAYAAFSPRHRI